MDESSDMRSGGAKHPNLARCGDVYEVEAVTSLALPGQIEALLERHRTQSTRPTQQEINDLYTDGCAAVLALETERLRVKRRMTAPAIDSANDPEAARESAELARRGQEIVDELATLKDLVRQLRTAVDWAQEDEHLAQPPRRRFRRHF